MPKVLIVDEQPEVLEMMRVGLSLSGYQVYTAAGVQAALQAAAHCWPDLVIMDMHTSGLGEAALCAQLRHLAGPRKVPILLISSMATAEQLQATLQAGAREYLRKPFEIGHLLQRVGALLSQV